MKNLCRVFRNMPAGPSLTGYRLKWVCETPDGKTYCDSRETAREIARDYRRERTRLNREGARIQARQEFLA